MKREPQAVQDEDGQTSGALSLCLWAYPLDADLWGDEARLEDGIERTHSVNVTLNLSSVKIRP